MFKWFKKEEEKKKDFITEDVVQLKIVLKNGVIKSFENKITYSDTFDIDKAFKDPIDWYYLRKSPGYIFNYRNGKCALLRENILYMEVQRKTREVEVKIEMSMVSEYKL